MPILHFLLISLTLPLLLLPLPLTLPLLPLPLPLYPKASAWQRLAA